MRIELEKVSYYYNPGRADEIAALQGVEALVQSGETVAVMGHEGSGKSTFLQLLNGLLRPATGSVLVDGEPLTERRAAALRTKVGLVFQYPEHQLFAATVFDDIAFTLRQQALDEATIAQRVRQAAAAVGLDLERLSGRRPLELSGGERRLAAIAGTVVNQPAFLLLDEPWVGLDPAARGRLTTLLSRLRGEFGMGLVVVSHCLEEVLPVANRAIVLDHGRVVFDGLSESLPGKREELRAWGLRSPVAAQFADLLRSRGLDLPKGLWATSEVVAAALKARDGLTSRTRARRE